MRRPLSLKSCVGVAVLGLALLVAAERADAQRGPHPKLDHFLCYFLGEPVPGPDTDPMALDVGVGDQFLSDNVRISRQPTFLCNPAEKTHDGSVTRIRDINHHLALHRFSLLPQPEREVIVSNQFGAEQRLTVRDTRGLLVPTTKQPHPDPKGLDHYVCYDTLPAVPSSQLLLVQLQDQFGFWLDTNVIATSLFCNPAAKTHNEITTRIQNRRDHLVCYFVSSLGRQEFSNQLTGGLPSAPVFVHSPSPQLLCVPSVKLSVDGVPVGRGAGKD